MAATERLGATVLKAPYEEWWQAIVDGHYPGLDGTFVHPVADRDVVAGHGTIGLEILEDLPNVDSVIVPFGGGGLSCGIASAVRARRPSVRVYGAEVETAAPLRASIAAGSAWSAFPASSTASAAARSCRRCGRSSRPSSMNRSSSPLRT